MFARERMDIVGSVLSLEDLHRGDIEIEGRFVQASNATLLASLTCNGDMKGQVIYKPIQGERPLWDFPDGTLAQREVATFFISDFLKWHVVPPTILRDGPFGEGMVQAWVDIDEEVDIVKVAQGEHPDIIRIALLDALVNNTDRKFGHLLPIDGRVLGCDHGVTFHEDDKLRTVIWQFRGDTIPPELLSDLVDLDSISVQLRQFISKREIDAFYNRRDRLMASSQFPMPSDEWPPLPWPAF